MDKITIYTLSRPRGEEYLPLESVLGFSDLTSKIESKGYKHVKISFPKESYDEFDFMLLQLVFNDIEEQIKEAGLGSKRLSVVTLNDVVMNQWWTYAK